MGEGGNGVGGLDWLGNSLATDETSNQMSQNCNELNQSRKSAAILSNVHI